MEAGHPGRLTDRKWTDQQRLAVEARGYSVALSAGAGCGKTFVLTERFLAQLQPPDGAAAGASKLGELVAITFTERAAREMRQRIRQACGDRLKNAPDDQFDHWSRLIRELDSARISTIHSFCGTLLRVHAVEAGLDPQFRVLEQAQADTLLYESLDQRLGDRLAERDEAVIELVVEFGLQRLYEMVDALLGRRQEIDFDQWRNETPQGLVARWEEYWKTDTLPSIPKQIAHSSAARGLLDVVRRHRAGTDEMERRRTSLLKQLQALPQSAAPQTDLKRLREEAQVRGGGGKKAWDSEEVYNRFRDEAAKLRKAIDAVEDYLDFDADKALPAAESALRLLAVADDVAAEYDKRKKQAGALDFNDLLIRARQLLAGPRRRDLRRRVSDQIGLLLVDEFQDTDLLQVELVKALCDGELARGKLFFVGDLKQSIYRFRGADPGVFEHLRGQIPPQGRLPLTLNFRSQPAVLDLVNALFCEELGPDYEPLRPHRRQVGPTPAVEFLWATEPVGGDSSRRSSASGDASYNAAGQVERLRRREADFIARRLRAILDSPQKIVFDAEAAKVGEPAARAVRPGDVALLFRALSKVDLYEEALQRYGIDYYLVGGHAFYAQQEIFDLLNLLRALSRASDEVSLAGVLRSPFFSLLDETLFWLSRHPRGLCGGLFADDLPGQLDSQQRGQVEFAAAVLGELRAMKDRVPVAELIGQALARTGYDAILLAQFLGERKLANLRKLIEQARSFDRSGIFTLADFITQLAQFVARQPKEALAATHPESTEVVRLMTIHQAKGLEFPVVVVPDVDRSRRASSASVAFTPQLGPMVKCPHGTSGFDLHMLAEGEQQQAELVRLFYVATTRAADYLILSAGVPKLGSARGPWMELICRRFDLLSGELRATAGGSPGGVAGAVVGGDSSRRSSASGDASCRQIEVKVTTSEPPLDSEPLLDSELSSVRGRPSIEKLIDEARQTAEDGSGRVPRYLAPIPPDPAARRQFSFSRLTGALHAHDPPQQALPLESDVSWEPPALDPVGLGTLVHEVLAEIDFAQPDDVSTMVRRHARRHLPNADNALDEPIELIGRFLASSRAAEMAAAEEVYPELEFLLAWPPGDKGRPTNNLPVWEGDSPIFPAGKLGQPPSCSSAAPKEPDGPYLQGFIDCLYRDAAGGWHLVDYKTNRVTQSTLAAVAAEYEMQMLLYALAAEKILGCPPVELVLSFLRPGLEYHFPWDDTARRRVMELVNQALP